MITTHFFADRDFLELLRFWEASRGGQPLPDWSGDIAVIPRSLLPNLIISDRRAEPVYHYVGEVSARRFGSDPTGQLVFTDVLQGTHRRYIWSIGAEALARRTPVFSTAIYQDAEDMVVTGRLYAPFTYRGSSAPLMLLTVQLFKGAETTLYEIGRRGTVHEIRRDMIALVPDLLARLEAARRDYQLALHTHRRNLAGDIERIAHELTGSALIPLPCFEEPEPVPET
jgi:hypothetical protein